MAGKGEAWSRALPAQLAAPMLDLRDRMRSIRDRLISDPKFQSWAAAFPLTRPIARARARAMFDLCAGFVYSQVLLACVRLKVLERVRTGPVEIAELAQFMRLSRSSAERLIDAAVALKLLDRRRGGRIGLGPHGAALIANPGVAAMIEHHGALYADLADPVALLRGEIAQTQLSRYWPYAVNEEAPDRSEVSSYTTLMAASQTLVAAEILDAYPFDRHLCLLDVGGGNGTFLSAVAKRSPKLALKLFDLPAVAELARENLGTAGLSERVQIAGGDFRRDSLPRGADVVSLVRVIHDHDDGLIAELLAKVRAALPKGGRIVIAEPLAETAGAEAVGHAYFGFYLMAMGSGRPRTFAEIAALLRQAGFCNSQKIQTRLPLQVSVITAECI